MDRSPAEIVRTSIRLSLTPTDVPPRAEALRRLLVFTTDYPHCDFDDPAHALPLPLGEAQGRQFFLGNARALYREAA